MTFRDFLKVKRKELNLSLSDIAKGCGVSRATVLRWERGEIQSPKSDRIGQLCSLLRCSPALLASLCQGEYDVLSDGEFSLLTSPKTIGLAFDGEVQIRYRAFREDGDGLILFADGTVGTDTTDPTKEKIGSVMEIRITPNPCPVPTEATKSLRQPPQK